MLFFLFSVLYNILFHTPCLTCSIAENSSQQHFKTVKKYDITEETREMLMDLLYWEYEFYKYVTQRFYNQLRWIRKKYRYR